MAAVTPSMPPKRGRSGVGWLVFLAIPPVVIVVGLVAMFAWEGSKGGITPKWRKRGPVPATAPATTTATAVGTGTGTGTNGVVSAVREEAR